MKRVIAAQNEKSEAFEDALDKLNDDFDYVSDGFEMLARRGKDQEAAALKLILGLNEQVAATMKQIAAYTEQ